LFITPLVGEALVVAAEVGVGVGRAATRAGFSELPIIASSTIKVTIRMSKLPTPRLTRYQFLLLIFISSFSGAYNLPL
jgi:hypothetical protein